MSSKKGQKHTLTIVSEWRLYILTCSMQKYFTFYQSLQANFPILLIKYLLSRPISDHISSRDQILKKSLSTFQPFTYVSNELYLINEMCIEGFSQRLESRIDQFWLVPKNLTKLPKIMIFTRIREIDQWSYEWKCFSVISCLPEMVFCIYIWLKSVDSGSFLCIG